MDDIFFFNLDSDRRDSILFTESTYPGWVRRRRRAKPDYLSSIELFANVGIEILELLLKEKFIDPEERQNESPTAKEFIDFVRKYPNSTVTGYGVDPDRDDYRVTITGLYCDKNITPKMMRDFRQLFSNATNLIMGREELYCWYD